MEYRLGIVNLAQRTSLGAVRAGCFTASPLDSNPCPTTVLSLPTLSVFVALASSFLCAWMLLCVASSVSLSVQSRLVNPLFVRLSLLAQSRVVNPLLVFRACTRPPPPLSCFAVASLFRFAVYLVLLQAHDTEVSAKMSAQGKSPW